VVSALERRLDADGESLHGLIQTDEPTEASWAGGPLLDATGSVIGITTGLGGEGLRFGYATPIDLVRQVADELMASGTVTHPWLGIEGVDLDEVAMRELGLTGGVRVRAVADPGPAAQSGLAPEDVITDVGGQPVRSSSGLVVAMRRLHAGDDVVVGYWREGDRQEAVVTIGRRP
jgi:S1-C subfamily serine protease